MKAQNQTEARLNNRNLILELLIRKAPISRIELSKLTGLSKMTVTNIINELAGEDLIWEIGAGQTAMGRKPISLQLKPNAKIFLGVYLSRSKVYAVAGDLCGNLIEKESATLPHDNHSLMQEIFRLLDLMIDRIDQTKIEAIGVASVGPIDYKKGVILNPPNFFEIRNLEIVKLLEERYAYRVYLDKDMNAAALAEGLFGRAKEISDYLYVGVTKGLGAAVISQDTLYRGAGGYCGEIGHVTIDMNGERCSCGNIGCLEMYASISDPQQIDLGKISQYLSAGLITLINLFDPQVIFLGHDIAIVGEEAAERLEKCIQDRFISREMKKIKVEVSAFRENSPIYGAFALAVCGYLAKM